MVVENGKYVRAETTLNSVAKFYYYFRLSQIGVVSYGSECPSFGVYGRVTKVKHWIQYIAGGALDTNCNQEIPYRPGNFFTYFTLGT